MLAQHFIPIDLFLNLELDTKLSTVEAGATSMLSFGPQSQTGEPC